MPERSERNGYKYENYYGGEPSIDHVIFKIVPDENAQEVAFVNGEVDFLEISTYDALQKYEADDTVTVIKYPEGRVNNMAINAFSPKFEDRRLVEAVFLVSRGAQNVTELRAKRN